LRDIPVTISRRADNGARARATRASMPPYACGAYGCPSSDRIANAPSPWLRLAT